jgi:predicted esterase YcpF (UPF0227 family)
MQFKTSTSMKTQTSTRCLYIHGFLSAPQSEKAKQTALWCEGPSDQGSFGDGRFVAPDMNCAPQEAMTKLEDLYQQHLACVPESNRLIVGSSLGGYYATSLVNRLGGRAVLINPACYPHQLLEQYIGEHDNPYTKQRIKVDASFIEQLAALFEPVIYHPEHFLVLLETGDEVLDVNQAGERFQQANMIISAKGDHSYQSYGKRWPAICNFLAKSNPLR